MTKSTRIVRDLIVSLILSAALCAGGIFLSAALLENLRGSSLYRQSRIVGSIFSEDSPGLGGVLTDARSRGALLKFTAALADAYVNFELIPYNEMQTFTAVHESLGGAVEIESFSYRRKTLIIAGSSPDEQSYREFLESLKQGGHFSGVNGRFYAAGQVGVRFEIECLPPLI